MAKKKPYRFFVYLLARCAAFPVYLMPRRMALALAKRLGGLAYFLVTRQRKKILENLRHAYGSSKSAGELRAIARQVFENAAQTAVEILQFPKLNVAEIDTFIDLAGTPEYLRSLLLEGKGIVSLTAHIGNWELLAGALCLKGIPMTVIGRKIYYEPYNRWIVQIRESVKMKMLYRDQSAREILACLKRNEVVGILPDQDIDSLPGVPVNFFGRPAHTLTAPVKLALRTGSPIVVGFLVRLPGDKYRLVLEEAIRPVIETTFEEAVKKYTIQWTEKFERVIRRYPEQWMWMHDRWKTQLHSDETETEKGL